MAMAGRKGAVTVATNMAGRGTDIMLGGNPDFIADLELHQRGLSPLETAEDYEAAWPEAVAKAKRAVAEEHEEVVAAVACTCSAPSGTSHGGSTTSSAAGRAARVTPARPGSTCPLRTT